MGITATALEANENLRMASWYGSLHHCFVSCERAEGSRENNKVDLPNKTKVRLVLLYPDPNDLQPLPSGLLSARPYCRNLPSIPESSDPLFDLFRLVLRA